MAPPTDSSITLNESEPHWNDTVSFTYEVGDRVQNPALYVYAYQDGNLVYATGGQPITNSYLLDSPAWPDGTGAQGVATIEDHSKKVGSKPRVSASVEFTILP